VDGASLPQEGPEPEPYQPGHDEQRDKQKSPLLVGLRWHRIHCKGRRESQLGTQRAGPGRVSEKTNTRKPAASRRYNPLSPGPVPLRALPLGPGRT
jgi:hypothetical protein